jgi:CDP-diacylglycerol--serine O-phosphatidyltransferase
MRPREAAVIALPNGFTLANLFFGIFGIVAASRGDFDAAARFIVFGGIADALDGRIARATKTGSRFGEELDSLVDAISFGTAPALIMYFAVFQSSRWEWIFCFFFTACAVMRLARFNVALDDPNKPAWASRFFTGAPAAVRQFLRFQPWIHSVIPLRTYSLSK